MSTLEPDLIKASICNGDRDGVRALTGFYFEEIWANMLNGNESEQIDALINLEIDLRNNSDDFCNSKEPIEHYLRKKWREKLAALRKRTVEFNPGYMVDKEELASQPKVSTVNALVSFQYRYFLLSLNPVLRMLFETKYYQGLSTKNGLFQVTHFLLNATSIANPKLSRLLKDNDELYEPLIPSFLISQAKQVFTIQLDENQETLRDLLQNLPVKRDRLKKALHKFDMKIFRYHNGFKERLKVLESLTVLEQAIILSNEYLEIESYIELWVYLNADSRFNADLKKELIQNNLFNVQITDKHIEWRTKAIIKNLKLRKKDLMMIENKIIMIQDKIDDRLKNTVNWKTR